MRTELVYVPGEYEGRYVDHLLKNYLSPGGRLLVANYMEDDPNPARGLLPGNHPTSHILERLIELGYSPLGHRDGYELVKGRMMRVAFLGR